MIETLRSMFPDIKEMQKNLGLEGFIDFEKKLRDKIIQKMIETNTSPNDWEMVYNRSTCSYIWRLKRNVIIGDKGG